MIEQVANKWPVFSSVFLIGVNFVFFLTGLLMIGLSSWGISHADDSYVTSALPAGALKLMVAIGVFLLLTAIFGWVGVKYNYNVCGRVTLGIYATILIFLMLLEFIAAGLVLSFTNTLNNFVPAQAAVSSLPIYNLVNGTYASCCCNFQRCTGGTCWVPANQPYPCDSLETFAVFFERWLDGYFVPVAAITIVIAFVQFFTAITACCNQCRGKVVEQQKKIASGPVSYDGLYEGDEAYSGAGGYGYENYMKGGQQQQQRPAGGQAPGATAPPAAAARAAPAK